MSTELIPVNDERPSFLAETQSSAGLEGLASKVRPSFVKIVQKNANDELLEKFDPGQIILTPDMTAITEVDGVVPFTPIMWYSEFCKWAPIKLKGVEQMIVARTFDMNNPIAIKSQSSATWSEPHPQHANDPKYNYRYCEHMNFVVKIMREDLLNLEPVLLSFVKTNYSVGQRLAKLALQKQASLYSGVYELGTRQRQNSENQWRVFTVDNYSKGSWVQDKALYDYLESAHNFYQDMLKRRGLETQYDEEVIDEDTQY